MVESHFPKEKRNVFSFTKEGKSEVILYEYNPDKGNIYKVSEMRDFMKGEQEADQYYKSYLSNAFSVAGGILAGYYIADNRLLAVATPLITSSIVIIPGAKVKKNALNEDYYKSNEAYRQGYKRVAKGKKFISSMKYGALSMLGSFVFFKFIDE